MTADKSPNLEVISHDNSGDSGSTGGDRNQERRRLPRLGLTAEQFRLAQNGKIFSVTDLSAGGMALRILDREDLRVFPVGSYVEGTLNLKRNKYPLKARVRHVTREAVGLQFESLEGEVQRVLQELLDPVALGKELKPIPSSESGTLWYHGPSGTDLLLFRASDGQYRRLTLFMLGSFVQWEWQTGLSTGTARASDQEAEEWGILRFETMLLNADATPDTNKLNIAKTLIMGSNLPQDLKKWCTRQIELPH